MVEGCGGHPTLDPCIPGHRIMVCDCVVEATEFLIPPSMDTVGMVLAGHRWCAIPNRT